MNLIETTVFVPTTSTVTESDGLVRVCASLFVPEAGGSIEWPINITLATCDIKGLSYIATQGGLHSIALCLCVCVGGGGGGGEKLLWP